MSSLLVETTYGPVRGAKLKTHTGKDIFTFRGIPYAKPPLGSLRFKVSSAYYFCYTHILYFIVYWVDTIF